MIDCIPFADTSFDYLIVVSSCKQGEVYSTALQIPRQTFKKIIQSYETKNDESLKNMIVPPYPVNVTEQMLNCFTEKYNLPITDGYNSLPVGDIIEELWVYSKARELLTGPADKDYCSKELQDIRNKIERLLHSLEEKIPLDNVKSLVEISKDVFNGSIFDDNSFNELVDQYDKHKMFS